MSQSRHGPRMEPWRRLLLGQVAQALDERAQFSGLCQRKFVKMSVKCHTKYLVALFHLIVQ